MSLADLPAQRPLRLPQGQAYGKRVLELSALVYDSHRHLPDQAYGSDYWQKVDVFMPENTELKSLPILVFAHGGSWVAGYKEWMAFMAPAITAIPAVFVSVSYRLAPENRYPLPFEDCLAAIKWAYEHADKIGGDKSKIYIGGHSAGAHLMALAAVRRDWQNVYGLPSDVVRGCLAVSAIFDLRTNDQTSPAETDLYGTFLESAEDAEDASPVTHVAPGLPPFIITIGENDFPFMREQAIVMRKKMESVGGTVVFQDLEGHDHFDTSERSIEENHPWLRATTEFLRSG